MQFDAWIGPVIIASAIAAMVTVLGWVVAGRRDRQAEDRQRVEKQDDICTALLAEIVHYVDGLEYFDLDALWETVVAEMEEDVTYLPFIPSERNDVIFHAIVANIHILPEAVIMPVARYYNQLFAVDAIIADLRSNDMKSEAQDKRISIYTDYISLKKQSVADGLSAISALQAHLSAQSPSVAGARAPAAKDGAR